MASGNQGRSNDRGRQNGGAERATNPNPNPNPNQNQERPSLQDVGQRFQEGAEPFSDRVREGMGATRDDVARRYRAAEGMMARNPTSSVLIGFGLGVGVGLVLSTIFTEQREPSWSERHVPDRLRNLDLSGSLQSSLDTLNAAIRELPDAITRHLPASMIRR